MKNLIKSVVLVSLCAFLFVSCEKEGQYLPKKKISRITTSTASTLWGVTTTAVTGYQDLEWSGKLLSKITLRDGDGDVYGAVVPQYDNKKRVTSLHCVTGDDIDDFKFTYDGKDLMKITRYSNDKDAVTEYSFRKDGKNVVEITVQGYSSKALDYAGINPLQFVLPQEIAEAIKPSDEKVSIIYRLAWDGKNVSSMEEIRNGVVAANYDWAYDDGINPLRGLFSTGNGSLNGFEELYSANNVLESHSIIHLSLTNLEEHFKYEYEYDNNYPVKKSWLTTASTGLEVVHTVSYMYL